MSFWLNRNLMNKAKGVNFIDFEKMKMNSKCKQKLLNYLFKLFFTECHNRRGREVIEAETRTSNQFQSMKFSLFFLGMREGKISIFQFKLFRHKNWDMNIKNSLVDVVFLIATAVRILWVVVCAASANKTFNIQIFIGEILTEVRVSEQRPRRKTRHENENAFWHINSTHPWRKQQKRARQQKTVFEWKRAQSIQRVTSAQLLRIFGLTRVLKNVKYSTEKSCSPFPGEAKWIHYHNFLFPTLQLSFPWAVKKSR